MVLEILTALKKEFAAHINKISFWTTLKMEAAGSSKMFVNLQIDVASYPRTAFLNCWALASIILGHEKFSWN